MARVKEGGGFNDFLAKRASQPKLTRVFFASSALFSEKNIDQMMLSRSMSMCPYYQRCYWRHYRKELDWKIEPLHGEATFLW